MTNEDYTIEILLKAEKLGLREEILNKAQITRKQNPNISLNEAIELTSKLYQLY